MNNFLLTSELLGSFPVKATNVSSQNFKFQLWSLSTILALLHIILPLHHLVNHFVHISFAPGGGVSSAQILANIAAFIIYGSLAAIRIILFKYVSQTASFLRALHQLEVSLELQRRSDKGFFSQQRSTSFFILTAILFLIDLGRKFLSQFRYYAASGISPSVAMALLAEALKLISLWSALPTAILFVALPGFHFVSVYERLCSKLSVHSVDPHNRTNNAFDRILWSSSRRKRGMLQTAEFLKNYHLLIRAYARFKKLASATSVCVVGQLFYGIIQILSVFSNISQQKQQYWYISLALLTHTSYLSLLSYTGRHLSSGVNCHLEYIQCCASSLLIMKRMWAVCNLRIVNICLANCTERTTARCPARQ